MTNQLYFYTDNFLSKKDLKRGHIYVQKDGRLTLYLGKDIHDRFVFYDLAGIIFEDTDKYSIITLGHYKCQVQSLITTCKTLMQNECNTKQLRALKGIPSLYSDFAYINFESTIDNWCKLSKLNIVSNDKTGESTTIWVKAKDLVPGELYYTGGLWRSM